MKEIALTQGKVALVDDEDFEFLSQWKWYLKNFDNHFYAARSVDDKRMHRIILNITDSKIFVDHKDGNGLNNQRNNIRAATISQNGANRVKRNNSSSRYLGVYWVKKTKLWRVGISKNGVLQNVGCFKDEKDAAIAYNNKAKELHGEFANLNQV